MAKSVPLNDVLITGSYNYDQVEEAIGRLILKPQVHKRAWWIFLLGGMLGAGMMAT